LKNYPKITIINYLFHLYWRIVDIRIWIPLINVLFINP